MKTFLKSFAGVAFGPVLLVSAAWASLAPSKPEGGIATLPTPWIIAHRGGGWLWPEETMEAYEAATAAGNAFVDVDCYQLINSAVVLMHDPTLDRTTNRHGPVDDVKPADWGNVMVDGPKLLGPGWGYYHAPYFDEVLARFGNRKILIPEAKDYLCRDSIVYKLREYHVAKDWALVCSTAADRLTPAIYAGYRTFLILLDMKQSPKKLKKMGLWGVACPDGVTEDYVHELKAAGLKIIGYTASRQWQRDEMVQWGVDGIPTDDPLYFDYSQAYRRNSDPYGTQKWAPGMLPGTPNARGYFVAPDKWGLDASRGNFLSCLQGWMCPIGGKLVAPAWSMDLAVTFHESQTPDRWASVAIMTTDAALNNDIPHTPVFGYNILFRINGDIELIKYSGEHGTPSPSIGRAKGHPIQLGETIKYRITASATHMTIERLDVPTRLTVADASYRGSYVTFAAKGLKVDFSNINLTVP